MAIGSLQGIVGTARSHGHAVHLSHPDLAGRVGQTATHSTSGLQFRSLAREIFGQSGTMFAIFTVAQENAVVELLTADALHGGSSGEEVATR